MPAASCQGGKSMGGADQISSEEPRDRKNMMPVAAAAEALFVLSEDSNSVRLILPPLPIAGMPEPTTVFMDFDAKAIDPILERLTVLRGRMLPPLPSLHKRN
jgi:hypothetical protein